MDKLSSKVHRVHMELGGKLHNSLRIETQFLKGFRVWIYPTQVYPTGKAERYQ